MKTDCCDFASVIELLALAERSSVTEFPKYPTICSIFQGRKKRSISRINFLSACTKNGIHLLAVLWKTRIFAKK